MHLRRRTKKKHGHKRFLLFCVPCSFPSARNRGLNGDDRSQKGLISSRQASPAKKTCRETPYVTGWARLNSGAPRNHPFVRRRGKLERTYGGSERQARWKSRQVSDVATHPDLIGIPPLFFHAARRALFLGIGSRGLRSFFVREAEAEEIAV